MWAHRGRTTRRHGKEAASARQREAVGENNRANTATQTLASTKPETTHCCLSHRLGCLSQRPQEANTLNFYQPQCSSTKGNSEKQCSSRALRNI